MTRPELGAAEGWQRDGTYVPCSECGAVDPPHTGPGIPIRHAGVKHLMSCARVPRLSPEVEARLRADLIEMERVRRRGAANSDRYIIGGVR